VDPADSNLLYAAVRNGPAFSFQESGDRGRTWNRTGAPASGRQIYVDPSSPRQDRTVYVVGSNSVAIREGGTWTQGTPRPRSPRSLTSPAASAVKGQTDFLRYIEKCSLGLDRRWSQLEPLQFPGESAEFQAVATSLGFPNTVYVSYGGLQSGNERYFGVAMSSNFRQNVGPGLERIQDCRRQYPRRVDHGTLRAGLG